MAKTSGGLRFTAPADENAAPERRDGSDVGAPAAPVIAADDAAQQKVMVRVLPQGAGRVHTGASDYTARTMEERSPTYPRGANFEVAADIAAALEARGLVEIVA
jgi:hypothetical protein